MLTLIGILVLSSNLSVAVETDAGFVERTFANSAAGAEELVAFAEQSVGNPPDGVHIVVGWLSDADNDEYIIAKLQSLGIKHALAGPSDVTAAIAKHGLPPASPRAVALSFRDRFAFLWQKRPK